MLAQPNFIWAMRRGLLQSSPYWVNYSRPKKNKEINFMIGFEHVIPYIYLPQAMMANFTKLSQCHNCSA